MISFLYNKAVRINIVSLTSILLIGICAWMVVYKHVNKGIPLWPGEQINLWSIEGRIDFNAEGGPVEVVLNIPSDQDDLTTSHEAHTSADLGFSLSPLPGGNQQMRWSHAKASGPYGLLAKWTTYRTLGKSHVERLSPDLRKPFLPQKIRKTVTKISRSISTQAHTERDKVILSAQRFALANLEPEVTMVREHYGTRPEMLALMLAEMLSTQNVIAQPVQTLPLLGDTNRCRTTHLTEVFIDGERLLINPATGILLDPAHYLVVSDTDHPLWEIQGNVKLPRLTFSIREDRWPEAQMANRQLEADESDLFSFSLRSLPVTQQNAFRRLLLIPLGVLIVAIMRNIVGLRTAGTFMPVLMAMAFVETQLLSGLVLFALVVSLGIMIRGQLARFRLLLVPRIGVVVTIVVLLMLTISMVGWNIGWAGGQNLSFFPIIVLAWTIERVSVSAEESGLNEALKEILGSLAVAIPCAILFMSAPVRHLFFHFPEIDLAILGLLLWVGTYTGYRLLELKHFMSLAKS